MIKSTWVFQTHENAVRLSIGMLLISRCLLLSFLYLVVILCPLVIMSIVLRNFAWGCVIFYMRYVIFYMVGM